MKLLEHQEPINIPLLTQIDVAPAYVLSAYRDHVLKANVVVCQKDPDVGVCGKVVVPDHWDLNDLAFLKYCVANALKMLWQACHLRNTKTERGE